MKPPFPHDRPYSWSQHSSFKYNPRQWYQKYVLGEHTPPSKETIFGKTAGEKITSDPLYLPQVPRLPIFEHELRFNVDGIACVGYVDAWCPDTRRLYEYKTSRNKATWTQSTVDKSGQLRMYAVGLYITENIFPESIDFCLHLIPTHIVGGEVEFIEPVEVSSFNTKITTADMLLFIEEIKSRRLEMLDYYNNYISNDIMAEDFFELSTCIPTSEIV